MERPFHVQIRSNRGSLALFLLLYAGVSVVTGYLVGIGVEPVLDPTSALYREGYDLYLPWQRFTDVEGLPRPFPRNAVGLVTGLFLVGALGYAWWMWERGGAQILKLTGARRLKERQLENVANEMAVAAGMDRPVRVWIVEDPSLNAFALVDPAGRGAVVVTRGLLETLNRSELQAVVAHETAHLENGDTRLMTLLFGSTRMLDLALWISYFGFRLLAWMGATGRRMADEEERRAEATDVDGEDEEGDLVWGGETHPWIENDRIRGIQRVLEKRGSVFMVSAGVATVLLSTFVVVSFLALPVSLLLLAHWRHVALLVAAPVGLLVLRLAISRNREFQADATAVRLTRNPGALRSALVRLREDRTSPRRLRPSVAHLCIAPLAGDEQVHSKIGLAEGRWREDGTILDREARDALWRTVKRLPPIKRPAAAFYVFVFSGLSLAGIFAAFRFLASAFDTHPSLGKRIERLEEMGG